MSRGTTLMLRNPMSFAEGVSYGITLVAQPIMCAAGAFLNLMVIVAFLPAFTHHYYRKTSLLIYLIALSVCNAIQLILSIFVIVLPACEQFIDENVYPEEYESLRRFDEVALFFSYPLLLSANYASIWILTLICAQRYQAICHPASVWKRRLQVVRKSKICVGLVVLFALLFNMPRFWELQTNGNEASLRHSFLYKFLQEGVIYGLVVYGMPMVFLLWLNYNTIRIVRTENELPRRPSAEHRTAWMTVTVFVLFFFCTTLSVSLRLILIFGGTMLGRVENVYFVDLSNLLANLNALAMPVVCFIYTRAFRDLFFVVRHAPSSGYKFAPVPPEGPTAALLRADGGDEQPEFAIT